MNESRFSLTSDSNVYISRECGKYAIIPSISSKWRHLVFNEFLFGVGIMLASRIDLHIFQEISITGVHYCTEFLFLA